MKKLKSIILLSLFTVSLSFAQDITVDEILANYFENTGGLDAWTALEGMQMTAKLNQGGMEFPVEIVNLADGRQYVSFEFQGMSIKQGVFDGETMWSTNFQSMKPEKASAEDSANMKLESNDFPDSFINYKEKGYTAELVGTEEIEGAETFKVKLVKEPMTIDGKEVDDVSYYYFDSESFIPILQESEIHSGPMAGQIEQVMTSDYQEVDGLYFPFSMSQGIKDGGSQPIILEEITLNPTVEDVAFAFPVIEEAPVEEGTEDEKTTKPSPKDLTPADPAPKTGDLINEEKNAGKSGGNK